MCSGDGVRWKRRGDQAVSVGVARTPTLGTGGRGQCSTVSRGGADSWFVLCAQGTSWHLTHRFAEIGPACVTMVMLVGV